MFCYSTNKKTPYAGKKPTVIDSVSLCDRNHFRHIYIYTYTHICI